LAKSEVVRHLTVNELVREMKLHGIELQVGEKPPDLYTSGLLDFNDIFLRMFEAFEKNPAGRVVLAFYQKTGEDMADLDRFGSLNLNRAWKVMRYNQLVTAKKLKESYEEYGQQKKRTITILEPTSLGIYAYENGELLKVTRAFLEGDIFVGIGKPYTTHNGLWKRVESMAQIGGVAKTRIEKWSYEFKTYFIESLIDKKCDEALELAIKFAREHIANAPTRHGRRNKIKTERVMNEVSTMNVNHSLTEYLARFKSIKRKV